MKILIIEDVDAVKFSLRVLLERKGYQVDSAGDGVEGLLLIRNNDYDVVITDILMPRMDGHSILKHFSDNPELRERTKVVVITGGGFNLMEDTILDDIRSKCDAFLQKPFRATDFLDVIVGFDNPPEEKMKLRSTCS